MMPLIQSQPIYPNDQIAEVTTYQGSMSLRIHAMGFLEIASVAARAALEGRTAIDAITPSIIYAIRHAAELFLKGIVAEVKETYGVTAIVPNKHGVMGEAKTGGIHSFQKLWGMHRSTIVEVLDYEASHGKHPNFDHRRWLADFAEIIDQIHRVDPDGQTLRYPTDRQGTPNLGGKMLVSVGQLECFARHTTDCFARFRDRSC